MSMNSLKNILAVAVLSASMNVQAVENNPASTTVSAPSVSPVPMQDVRDSLGRNKQAYIEQRLKLSDAEAKKFWPVYFAYQEMLGKLNYRVQGNHKFLLRSWDKMNDTAVKDIVGEAVNIEEERSKLTKQYMKKFLAAVPAKKVAHYFVLEYKFRSVVNFDLAAGLPTER